jgi:hypothetical protein
MATSQSTIIYKEIPGFLGYRVGNDGSVWSCRKLKSLGGRNGTVSILSGTWKQMKVRRQKEGYFSVNIGGHTFRVHTLVLITFVGPCPQGMVCRHFPDPEKTNNNLSNLQWGTHAENMQDRNVHGTQNTGERNGQSRLNDAAVRDILNLYTTTSITQRKLAQMYRVHVNTISSIVHRRRWKHIK